MVTDIVANGQADMDDGDVTAALVEAEIEVADGTSAVAMRAALKHNYGGREMNALEVRDGLG